ncbi:N-ethylammeline chlorohydrolase [Azospira sp. I13]|jgi:5-methylthioadenosine/S-adenosylhomocysteine deaminase|uniref:TRZ/ATZ family hydrolase n=1 Tax=Azospira sp. I13 TaxID=1765050 RepID=UPI000D4D8821|nr:TRZ/ATZ family hydrolase [Azospira sp. I13]GBG02731.1 N-ethylammeline chlorohydrolase [Azospira sp. I13]
MTFSTPPRPVDLLIEARWIIPVEPAGITLENHAVAITDGKIVAVLPQSAAREELSPAKTVQLGEQLLIPGLVNLHTHAAMTLLRGLADDQPLMTWLQEHIWPAESRFVSREFVRDGTRLAAAEMLRSGTTCFSDMYFFPREAAEAAVEMGIRSAQGLVVLDFPNAYASDAEDYLDKGLTTRDALRDEPLLSFCLAPHAPYTVSNATFERVLTLAEQLDIPIHLHLHETEDEIQGSLTQYGVRPVARLQGLGLLSPSLIAVHAVHLLPDEIQILAAHNCSIAHCPASNLKLGSGIAPVAAMLQAGINVGIGTDGAASNNRLDLLSELRLACLLAKGSSRNARVMSAHVALRMATLNGAQALGLQEKIGSIETGKAADLCAIGLQHPELAPCYDPASHAIHAAGREHVSHVWVAGQLRVENGSLCGIGKNDLIRLAKVWQNKIRD